MDFFGLIFASRRHCLPEGSTKPPPKRGRPRQSNRPRRSAKPRPYDTPHTLTASNKTSRAGKHTADRNGTTPSRSADTPPKQRRKADHARTHSAPNPKHKPGRQHAGTRSENRRPGSHHIRSKPAKDAGRHSYIYRKQHNRPEDPTTGRASETHHGPPGRSYSQEPHKIETEAPANRKTQAPRPEPPTARRKQHGRNYQPHNRNGRSRTTKRRQDPNSQPHTIL